MLSGWLWEKMEDHHGVFEEAVAGHRQEGAKTWLEPLAQGFEEF